MKVLVTGGAGFIGSHVVDALVRRRHRVAVVDDLSTGHRQLVHRSAQFHRHDIREPTVSRVLSRIRPRVVVHAAAQASVSRSLADPIGDASVNILGTINLLHASRSAGVRSFIYISTGGAAYGDTDVVPTPEDHALLPESFYGLSKVCAERYLDRFAAFTRIRALTLRLANVYGPRQDPRGEAGVIAIFMSRLFSQAHCVVNGDGDQTRDFVYVGDVADAVVRAVECDEASGAVNVSTGIETTVNALYKAITDVLAVHRPAKHAPPRPGEQRRSALSPEKARAILGWTPSIPLDDGLRRTADYFRRSVTAHQDGSRPAASLRKASRRRNLPS